MASESAVAEVRAPRLPSLAAALASLPNWSILLFAAIAVRAIAFGNPIPVAGQPAGYTNSAIIWAERPIYGVNFIYEF